MDEAGIPGYIMTAPDGTKHALRSSVFVDDYQAATATPELPLAPTKEELQLASVMMMVCGITVNVEKTVTMNTSHPDNQRQAKAARIHGRQT